MADTLLTVLQRVLIATGQNPSVTTVADTDDTRFIAEKINDALLNLRALRSTHTENNGTITVTVSTRLFSVVAGLDVYDLNKDLFRLDNAQADWVQLSYLAELDAEYDTRTGEKVRYLYFENNKIGVYPILAATATQQTIKYIYPDVWARLTVAADVFPYPDPHWITYCEKYAQLNYELFKGLGNPMATSAFVEDQWHLCVAKAALSNNRQLRGNRRYG